MDHCYNNPVHTVTASMKNRESQNVYNLSKIHVLDFIYSLDS